MPRRKTHSLYQKLRKTDPIPNLTLLLICPFKQSQIGGDQLGVYYAANKSRLQFNSVDGNSEKSELITVDWKEICDIVVFPPPLALMACARLLVQVQNENLLFALIERSNAYYSDH